MSSVTKVFRVLALAVMVAAAAVAQAEAATISISPASQTVAIGDTVTADILVSGLAAGESVGGLSLLLSFSEAILSGFSYVADPDAKMGVAACGFCDFSFGFDGGSGSPLDLFFIADPALDHAALKALQGDSFRLATISFMAMANGLSGLNMSSVVLSDATGVNQIPTTTANGSVCVGGVCNAPEPGLLSLLVAGLAAMGVRRRARA
jgi:hypothetical protein